MARQMAAVVRGNVLCTAGDGSNPRGALIMDAMGNLYGTTCYGGPSDYGTVFKLTANGTETVLYAFGAQTNDGAGSQAGLLADKYGNLYGTTWGGGTYGSGTVFKLSASGTETVLYSFTGGNDGGNPDGQLIEDTAGNLYSTTQYGGKFANCPVTGCGTVFRLAPDGVETVLHAFAGGTNDGATPEAGLLADTAGNLYSTTWGGGAHGSGTVFKVSPSGTESVLYSFTGGSGGGYPFAEVIIDSTGNIYGTTGFGGKTTGCPYSAGCGVVFKLSATGTESALHSFAGRKDGDVPYAGLMKDHDGHIVGTTTGGDHNILGGVFRLEE